MSEIEEEEEEIVDHWSHDHPLTLVETRGVDRCYGCERRFRSGEQGYGCSKKCCYGELLHEECAKMARKIRHALHPQHILIQYGVYERIHEQIISHCSICKQFMYHISYLECKFGMHMSCAQGGGEMEEDDEEDEQKGNIIRHPSHPKHELKFWSKKCSFKCDACGTTRRGSSYTCTNDACQYWIHEGCASLPATMKREDHHHSLSLSFHVPPQYMKYNYKCEVCLRYLLPKYWIYHCKHCSYAVHLKCAFKKSTHTTTNNAANEKGIIRFPINDVAEEQIKPFVMRQGGIITIPSIPRDDDRYDFIYHKHQLTLVSSSSSSHHDQSEEKDDDDYGKRFEDLICDGCITPISSSPSSSSSSSSSSDEYYYMSCSECKYYLHLACFHLPLKLASLPLLHQHNHDLILQSCDKLEPWVCQLCIVCKMYTNGLFYACTICSDFKVDVKCASMPDAIYHTAHHQHPLNLLSANDYFSAGLSCAADCGIPPNKVSLRVRYASNWDSYACKSCEFTVHVTCARLPASITSRRWDKHHLLPLTYNANLNHPDDFYCDHCETEMNPKSWMYHCCHCDLSFHPNCFKTTSGSFRNIKLGQEYKINGATAHPHPLTYQLLTTKRRCDLCGDDMHEREGFFCASCNFFICFYSCGQEMIKDGRIQAVD